MTWFDRLFSLEITWRDAVDVIVVALILYSLLALIRGTRAAQISLGLMVLGSTFFIARAFDLPALEAISAQVLFYLPFAVIVLFQQEIRHGLARMGTNPFIALFRRRGARIPFEAIVEGCEMLAAKRVGALVAVEGAQSLRMYEEGAKPLDALLTRDLLVTIFTPGGPLHDGAVIVRRNRISVAGAFLPLLQTANAALGHGTRHRAALGLSEESDALVIIVSEENGSIAVASEGILHENLDRPRLLQLITKEFGALS